MKKTILMLAAIFCLGMAANAQKMYTKTAAVSFFSDGEMEDIEAQNSQGVSVLNTETGALEFVVLIKGFKFEKALMQEHFNENYMESDKYPKGAFAGKITNLNEVNFKKDGTYNVDVEGDLVIHGVSKNIKTKGVITVKGGKVSASAKFNVKLADHKIEIPSVVSKKIAQVVAVTVKAG
jgi:polyisoprenoid-binding protein YceI